MFRELLDKMNWVLWGGSKPKVTTVMIFAGWWRLRERECGRHQWTSAGRAMVPC